MKIMFATDGEAPAEYALKEGARLLPLSTAEVVVVSVLDPEERIGGNPAASEDLKRAVAIFRALGISAQPIEVHGHPAESIAKTAQDLKVDLVVIGSTGLGRIGRFLLGSVSDEVVHRFPGAVLVIHAPH